MQNFRISPPRRKGVFPRCCSTHSLTSVDVQFHVFSWFYSIQLTLAQFNDFTKLRTGIKFSICFNCSMCTARQTLDFFPLILFFLFFGLHTTAHNSFPCEGSVEAAPNRETWTNFHHNTLVYFFVFHLRTAREIDFLCCSGNYAKLPVYEGKLRAGSFLESRLPVKILSSSSSHNSTLTRNLREICFLPGHDFCWNCGGRSIRSSSGPKYNLDRQGSHTHTLCGGWRSERQ